MYKDNNKYMYIAGFLLTKIMCLIYLQVKVIKIFLALAKKSDRTTILTA